MYYDYFFFDFAATWTRFFYLPPDKPNGQEDPGAMHQNPETTTLRAPDPQPQRSAIVLVL